MKLAIDPPHRVSFFSFCTQPKWYNFVFIFTSNIISALPSKQAFLPFIPYITHHPRLERPKKKLFHNPKMVKLTIVGRVKDGLPLAQEARYMNNETTTSHNLSSNYKQQAEFLLNEISKGALPLPSMTIRVDHHSFNYLVVNGICFITLCDSSYPRKLAFNYLQDLQKEFDKFDNGLIYKITKPYSFVKFDSIISSIRKQYIDTRTQANLSKLNANRHRELDIVTGNMSDIVERRRNSEILETPAANYTPQSSSLLWGSPRLEAIALIWTPIAIITVIAWILLWVSLVFTDDYLISTL
ncbi:hypothetical protein PVK06_045953 [Gossypium arboreum]|uniref:Longin domain-containing protein n=5 Tax=Gossypium TaxID=3633 RepID=A0ABR0MVR9_GOSAR|nr:hypothetical protein PVK06_045953 [Gossypium arboreum]